MNKKLYQHLEKYTLPISGAPPPLGVNYKNMRFRLRAVYVPLIPLIRIVPPPISPDDMIRLVNKECGKSGIRYIFSKVEILNF